MQPEIVIKPGFQIVGMQYRGGDEKEKCRDLWHSFKRRADEVLPFAKKPIRAFGIHTNFDEYTCTIEHTAGLEVEYSSVLPEKMISLKIPNQEYAVFECTFPEIMNTFGIFDDWVKTSDYIRSNGPELLRFAQPFDKNFNHQNPEAAILLYIPVLKNENSELSNN